MMVAEHERPRTQVAKSVPVGPKRIIVPRSTTQSSGAGGTFGFVTMQLA